MRGRTVKGFEDFAPIGWVGGRLLTPAGAVWTLTLRPALPSVAVISYLLWVPKLSIFLKYWFPVVIWMVVIFSASSDRASFQRSSRILGPLIRWICPGLPEEKVSQFVTFGRKCAHLGEYAFLALLCLRALRGPKGAERLPWDWRLAATALLIVVLYAASDEFHQSFVPSRQASVVDVCIDSSGGFFALIFLWAVGRWRHRW